MFRSLKRQAQLRHVLALFVLCAGPVQAADEFTISPAQVKSLGVELQRLDSPVPLPGMAYPARVVLPTNQQSVLSAPVAGVIDQILVAENDTVKIGRPLLRIVSPELGELQLRLSEAASKARLSQKVLQRERLLIAEGIIPERRVQEAESLANENQARLNHAQAALGLAGLDAASIRRVADGGPMQDALLLRARTPGVVVNVQARLGQRVQQADSLVQISDMRKLWLDVQLPVARQNEVQTKGGTVQITDRDVTAKILGFGSVVSDSQTLNLRAEVTSGAQRLRIGEFVQVRVPFVRSDLSWSLPVGSVVRQEGNAYVFVRSERGFIPAPVSVLDSSGQFVRVTGALKPGQQIAVTSLAALKATWLGLGGKN